MDRYSPEKRSSIMRSVRSSGTDVENRLSAALLEAGIKFSAHEVVCGCRPDLVLRDEHVVVFVDGCFWHGCSRHRGIPKSNREFWVEKIRGNRRRDRRNTLALQEAGWTVIRIWEHTVNRAPGRAVASIKGAITRARAASGSDLPKEDR